ncbi:MAG: hypothetical protein WCE58_05725 [Gallionella sp.]
MYRGIDKAAPFIQVRALLPGAQRPVFLDFGIFSRVEKIFAVYTPDQVDRVIGGGYGGSCARGGQRRCFFPIRDPEFVLCAARGK